MKKTQTSTSPDASADDLLSEYAFDYSKARPNRFAEQLGEDRVIVVLDPDIAEVFTTSESVNTVLRALIVTMPKAAQ